MANGAYRVGWRIVVCLLAAVISVLGSAGIAVASSGYHETFTQTIDSGNSLNAVSCVPGTTECVVADSQGDAFYATNVSVSSAATWNSWSGPEASPSHAVECPSATLCMLAAGEVNGGGGDMYRSSSFGGPFFLTFNAANGVGDISCPSTSFCVSSAEGGGFIRYATNPEGILWKAVSIGTGAMRGVSCVSSSFCAVVDDSGNARVATTEEGIEEASGWTATNVNDETALRDVACASTTSCIAVDGGDAVLNLAVDGGGNASVSRQTIQGADGLVAVDCRGVTCAAVDENGGVFASTNSGGDWLQRYGEGGPLTSVSCASASLCAAAATTGDVTVFNPATTTPPLTIVTTSLPAGDVGTPYEAEAEATGGEAPYEWSASGLPPGLSIDPGSGEVSGTPTEAVCVGAPCEYPVTLTATDKNGTEATALLTIELAVNAYALKVATAGGGSGKVDSSPAGIDGCGAPGGSCEAAYEEGSVVTLTARSAADSTFDGWSGGGCSGVGSCQITMTAETVVTADFSKIPVPPSEDDEGPDPPPSPPIRAGLLVEHLHPFFVRSRCAGQIGARRAETRQPCFRLKIVARGEIASQAQGALVATATIYLRGQRWTVSSPVRIVDGQWSARLVAPRVARNLRGTIDLAVQFAGSPGVQAGSARRRTRLTWRDQRCARRNAPARCVVVSYRREGGFAGKLLSLAVLQNRMVRVGKGQCMAKFKLPRGAWRRLRASLADSHLHSNAGSYPAPEVADAITHVIRAGRDIVRVAPAPRPENEMAMRELGPLLNVLDRIASAGEHRMHPRCAHLR